MATFSEIILELRKSRGLSQQDMADKLGVSKSTIAMWETNKRTPTRSGYEDIADTFNVDMDYLLGKQSAENKYRELLKAIEHGQLLGSIANNNHLLNEIEKLLALPNDQQDLVFNQIDYLHSKL